MKHLFKLFGALMVFHCVLASDVLAGNATGAGRVFAEGKTENRDGAVELNWKYVDGALESGALAGVRIYRLRDGDEMAYRVDPLLLIKDVGMDTKIKVSDLKNGSRVIFEGQAYDKDGKEFDAMVLFGFPGSRAKETPPKVRNVYTASGAHAIGVFWEPLKEVNIAGYDVFRRRTDETEFELVGHVKKVVGMSSKQSGAVLQGVLPEIQPSMFRDKSILPGISYVYLVRAVDMEGKPGPGVESGSASWEPARSPRPEEVLLLARKGSRDSLSVARHYAERRGVPKENILELKLPPIVQGLKPQIIDVIREHLLDKKLAGKIRVIVPCYGIQLRLGNRALDSMLMDLFDRYTWGRVMGTPNPLFGRNEHFDPTWGLYLVSRLDGPDVEIARGLVDKAVDKEKSVTAKSGSAFFVRGKHGDAAFNISQRFGIKAVLEDRYFTKTNFVPDDTMWFFAWGHDYEKPIRKGQWPVGAVAAYLKSNTLAWLSRSKAETWVQGLLEAGITGTFGSVVEPYVQGYTRGDVFFDRFWSGKYTFAESYAMSTPTVRWAMSSIGDPFYIIIPGQ
ncbi:MAG: TIGR03790 family protein [Desulfomicrobium sp.]